MSGIVFAAATCVLNFDGRRVRLQENDPWDAEDAIVKARPELFCDRPTHVFGNAGPVAPVEQATRAPGERRVTRRD